MLVGLGAIGLLVSGCSVVARGPAAAGAAGAAYPDDPNPEATIERARADAASGGRRVLLVFGANWCSDSRSMMHRLREDSRVAPIVRDRYVLVPVNVGARGGPDWDSPTVRRYGRPFEGRGIPALVVLEGGDGRQLTTRENNPLRDSDHKHPRKVAEFLRTWAGG